MPLSARRALALGTLAALSVAAKPLTILTPVAAAAADRGFMRSLPLAFEANQGQHAAAIRFAARGTGYNFAFLNDGARIALRNGNGDATFSMRFDGARRTIPVGEQRLPGKAHYFVGSDAREWLTDVPTYARVRYDDIYPGIDAVFYGNGGQLEYDLVVAPGADPSRARIVFDGVDGMRVTERGALELAARGRTIAFSKPIAYQEIEGAQRQVDAVYQVTQTMVSFSVGAYDATHPLVIDPVLVYSTHWGGEGYDQLEGVATDPAGNVYLTGTTWASDSDSTAAFVTKINKHGTAVVYSTYLAGSPASSASQTLGSGIAVDPFGSAYVVGHTQSSTFPTTSSAFQRTYGGHGDGYAVKLSAAGDRLMYATFLGGLGEDHANDVAVTALGHAAVVGRTSSRDFPVTTGALDVTNTSPGFTGFVVKLNGTGGALYGTYLTGNHQTATGVAVDETGHAFVTGQVATGFATTPGAFQPEPRGDVDGFVAKITTNGTAFAYATYLGSEFYDAAADIAVDPYGRAYIVGTTWSPATFPVSEFAFQRASRGESDAFVTVLLERGDRLWYSTLIGGTDIDSGVEVDLDPWMRPTIVGITSSSDFPIENSFQPSHGGGLDDHRDAFVASFHRGAYSLVYSSYLGGSSDEFVTGVGVATAARTTITGSTSSRNFPVVNPIDGWDACPDAPCGEGFIMQIAPATPGTISSGDIVLYAADATTVSGAWRHVVDETAAGGERLHHPDAGAAKLAAPLANPANYFEVTAQVEVERPYTLWIRGKAQNDHFNNDSVFVQFSTAVSGDNPDEEPYPNYVYRIGTTNALDVVLEDCRHCGLKGWAWTNSGYGFKVGGPPLTFDTEQQTIRIQTREDGVSIDQIVLAPYAGSAYAAQAPGFQKEDDTILPRQSDGRNRYRDIVIYPGIDATALEGAWNRVADSTAAGRMRVRHPNANVPKLTTPLANPVNYFEAEFDVTPWTGYALWIRGKADNDYWGNDSVFVQFSNSYEDDLGARWRIGSTDATTFVLEDCSGCGVEGWGWQDNAYGAGALGPLIWFHDETRVRIRVQTREDGLSIDQIILSPQRYMEAAPGATKNDATIVPR